MDVKALLREATERVDGTGDAGLLHALNRCLRNSLMEPIDEDMPEGSVVQDPEPLPVLRAEAKRLLKEVKDAGMLESVIAFLQGERDELLWRSVLSQRAARAEADFAAGRVYTMEQVEAHFHAKRKR